MVDFIKCEEKDLDLIMEIEGYLQNLSKLIKWSRDKHIDHMDNQDCTYLKIIANEALEGFAILKITESNMEIIRIVTKTSGKGFGKKLMEYILHYSFEVMRVHRVWLDVFTDNLIAYNFYKKSGFSHEGTLRESIKRKDEFVSLHILSMLKSEYDALLRVSL